MSQKLGEPSCVLSLHFRQWVKGKDKCLVRGFQQVGQYKNSLSWWRTCQVLIWHSEFWRNQGSSFFICILWPLNWESVATELEALGVSQYWALFTPCVTDGSKMEYKVIYYLKNAVTVLWGNSGMKLLMRLECRLKECIYIHPRNMCYGSRI